MSMKPAPSDFDGDVLYGTVLQPCEIAHKTLLRIQRAGNFDETVAVFIRSVEFNRSKFNSLSRRRKKIEIAGYTCYRISTGELVHKRFKHLPGIEDVPIMYVAIEEVGAPLTNFLKAWTDNLVG